MPWDGLQLLRGSETVVCQGQLQENTASVKEEIFLPPRMKNSFVCIEDPPHFLGGRNRGRITTAVGELMLLTAQKVKPITDED